MILEDNQVYHVGISEAKDVTGLVLETTKTTLETLQRFEKLKEVRAEKKKVMEELQILLNEISDEIDAVKDKLPKHMVSSEAYKNLMRGTHLDADVKKPKKTAKKVSSKSKEEEKPVKKKTSSGKVQQSKIRKAKALPRHAARPAPAAQARTKTAPQTTQREEPTSLKRLEEELLKIEKTLQGL